MDLKRFGLSVIALITICGLTFGETPTWRITEIERAAPYSVVLNTVPGLTSEQYATASLRVMMVLNGEMSADQMVAFSADEPLTMRASIAIVDALIADKTKQGKTKPALLTVAD
jgi:hypothetical protein